MKRSIGPTCSSRRRWPAAGAQWFGRTRRLPTAASSSATTRRSPASPWRVADPMKTTSILAWVVALALASTAAAGPPPELARWFEPQKWERDTDGPILSLGRDGDFDDRHVFAPAVIEEQGQFLMWYSGSRGTPGN